MYLCIDYYKSCWNLITDTTNHLHLFVSGGMCSVVFMGLLGHTWMHTWEPRGKQGIELLCVCLRQLAFCCCCLQESCYAQQCHCTCRLTMIRVQLHCWRQQWQEADRCRYKWGCGYTIGVSASCRCYFWESSSARQYRCTFILVNLLLLSASDSISTLWWHTWTAVDCIPEHCRQNWDSTPHCTKYEEYIQDYTLLDNLPVAQPRINNVADYILGI